MATKSQPIKVMVVNGPNLGRLGVRQPDVYGSQDLEELRRLCTRWGSNTALTSMCAKPMTKRRWCIGCTRPRTGASPW